MPSDIQGWPIREVSMMKHRWIKNAFWVLGYTRVNGDLTCRKYKEPSSWRRPRAYWNNLNMHKKVLHEDDTYLYIILIKHFFHHQNEKKKKF